MSIKSLGYLRIEARGKLDICSTTGHIGRDDDTAKLSCTSDDVRFLFVILRIEHRVDDVLLLEESRDELGCLDG